MSKKDVLVDTVFLHKLSGEGKDIKVIDYDVFLPDEEDREYYEARFVEIHDEIRTHLEAAGGKKQLKKLVLPQGQTVFTYRNAGMSLGDVHMILMAFFLQIPWKIFFAKADAAISR